MYWHMGETTMRFGSSRSRRRIGVRSVLVMIENRKEESVRF
jgi:hypothetical protein